MTLREEIRDANDVKIVAVPTPEWPGTDGRVHARNLESEERDDWEASLVEERGKKREVNLANARAKLVARSACDAEGELLFTPGDIEWLGKKNAAVMDRLYEQAATLSGIRDEDIEELAGNSVAAPSGECGTESPDAGDAQ